MRDRQRFQPLVQIDGAIVQMEFVRVAAIQKNTQIRGPNGVGVAAQQRGNAIAAVAFRVGSHRRVEIAKDRRPVARRYVRGGAGRENDRAQGRHGGERLRAAQGQFQRAVTTHRKADQCGFAHQRMAHQRILPGKAPGQFVRQQSLPLRSAGIVHVKAAEGGRRRARHHSGRQDALRPRGGVSGFRRRQRGRRRHGAVQVKHQRQRRASSNAIGRERLIFHPRADRFGEKIMRFETGHIRAPRQGRGQLASARSTPAIRASNAGDRFCDNVKPPCVSMLTKPCSAARRKRAASVRAGSATP